MGAKVKKVGRFLVGRFSGWKVSGWRVSGSAKRDTGLENSWMVRK
jgi:hypothetical protein